MKLLQAVLFLLLGICSISPSEETEGNCPGKLHSEDSCSSIDTPEPLPLAYTCLTTTFNGIRDERAPIVIVHGFQLFKEVYMDLAQFLALKTARKVCAVDLRNHGDSPWSDETDSKAMAADLALFMKTLDTDKLVVIGHSLGGKIAVEFALTYPEKVEKIVVEDMRPNGLSEEVLKLFRTNRDWKNIIPKGLTEYEAKKKLVNFYRDVFENENAILKYDESLIDYVPIKCSDGKCSWKQNIEVLGKIFTNPLKFWPDSSGKSEKPALFMYGEKSMFKVLDVKEEIMELFPAAKLFEVKGRGHIMNPYSEYRNEVANFINAKD